MSRDPEPPLTPEEMVGVYVGSMRAPDVMRDLTTAGYTICGPDCGCSCLSASLPVGDDTPSRMPDRMASIPFARTGDDTEAVLSAVDHLFRDHDCDQIGYEEVMAARDRIRSVGDDTPSLDAAHEALSAALYQPDKTHDDLVTAAMNVLAVAERSAQSRPKGTPGWLSEALNSGDGTYKP